jgi:hypothetical protein
MKIIAAVLTLAFIASGLLYALRADPPSTRADVETNPAHTAQHAGHDHDRLVSLPPDTPAPTLALEVSRDAVAGWNVRLLTSHFTFSPERASGAHVPGEGHAHLYLNGDKLARLYGPWFHLDALPPGDHELTATLNTNDHAAYAINETPIRAAIRVTVAADQQD